MRPCLFSPPQRGTSMIEVLVTLVVVAFGLLGLANFVMRANASGVESNQRARALALVTDMSERIKNNRTAAAAYAGNTVHGAEQRDCNGTAAGPARDLCEWNNLLAGSNDAIQGQTDQALGFRGCVVQQFATPPLYIVTVAWGSITPGPAPSDPCASGSFGDDSYRRVVRSNVRIAL